MAYVLIFGFVLLFIVYVLFSSILSLKLWLILKIVFVVIVNFVLLFFEWKGCNFLLFSSNLYWFWWDEGIFFRLMRCMHACIELCFNVVGVFWGDYDFLFFNFWDDQIPIISVCLIPQKSFLCIELNIISDFCDLGCWTHKFWIRLEYDFLGGLVCQKWVYV